MSDDPAVVGTHVLEPTEDGMLRTSRPHGLPIEVGTLVTCVIDDVHYRLRAVRVEGDAVSWVCA